jgi:hypothetical protein
MFTVYQGKRKNTGNAFVSALKGLSHEIDIKNVDKNIQNYCRPLQGPRLVFEFFRGSSDF